MEEEDEEEAIDEAEDNFEEDKEFRESQMDNMSATFPEQKEQQNIYNWFWRVVRLKKPFSLVKVGRLTKEEIGKNNISIRDSLNLWVLGNTFHHKKFGSYFATLAKINSASSMAKDGWFMDLSISQKKVRERTRHSQRPTGQQSWRIFKRNQEQAEE